MKIVHLIIEQHAHENYFRFVLQINFHIVQDIKSAGHKVFCVQVEFGKGSHLEKRNIDNLF